jgi:translocation and assembly module TamB
MRVARRLLHAVIIVLTLVVGAAAAAIIVSQTAWFKNWLRGYIVRSANQYLNGTLSIERLGGNLFFGIELQNVGVSMDGEPVVAVQDLGVDYNVFQLVARGLSVDNIRLNHPVIYLRRDGDTWSLSKLIKKQETEADRQGPAKPITIDDIGVSGGSIIVDGPVGTSGVMVPKRVDHLDAKLAFRYEPVRYSIEISHVSFRGTEPSLALNALSGGIAVRDDTVFVDKLTLHTAESSLTVDGAVENYLTRPAFKLQVASDKLSVPEIARIVPALAGIALQPRLDVKVDGPLDQLRVALNVVSTAGVLSGTLTADVEAPGQSVAGDISVRHLDLAPLVKDARQKSDISGHVRIDLKGESLSAIDTLHGTAAVQAERVTAAGYTAGPIDAQARVSGRRVDVTGKARAYGASAAVNGRVTLPARQGQDVAFDLRGQLRNIDVRQLPPSLKAPPASTDVNAQFHVAGTPSNLSGDARFDPTTVAGASIEPGSTIAFSLRGQDVEYSTDATVRELDLQRVGEAFRIPALAADRYASRINGHVVATGRGTTPKALEITANGTLTDTSILGGRIPQLAFDASMSGDTAHLNADGAFSGFDPAVLGGRPEAKGEVAGHAAIDATLSHVSAGVTPDSVEATVRLNLDQSNIGDLAITRASLDGDYRDSTADVRTFEIVGRDLNVAASGTLALNDTSASNLKLHADSPSLESIGKLAGQPLAGIAKVDATITGNRRRLEAKGNLTADGVKYEQNGALTATTDFTAAVPDLDVQNATVTATTRATFVTVAGQNLNELTAQTDYSARQLQFDATARQPQRSLGASGRLLLHPDHQEVHLTRLDLRSQGVQWQTAPDSQATIQYGEDAIAVSGLRLVNGDQQITAEGTLGGPEDALTVTMKNVDVATVDALLLREPQLSGRLDATAEVTGSKSDPAVDAQFGIKQGGFRQFKYDTFGGTVKYAARGVDVDARLEQNATTWMTAKGYAPLSDDAPRRDYDLHVDSSAIDLGIVQGFTTALTNVTGTVQAKIDVSGTASDPRPNGAVTIQKAAFEVQPTGVSYSELDGRIDLQPDKVHIEQIRVLDNHRQPLTITGDLAIQEREVGGVSIQIASHDFKVIDNKMGNVRVNSDLRIAGQLSAPRIEGDLGVSTGQINLDPILALMGDTAYATSETEFATKPVDASQAAPASSPFDALYAFVHLTVPNDLVIKANNLSAPGSPIGLGALTVTVGGDVTVHKAPWDQPRLYGDVNTVRGNYDFQGRRFEILRDGTVRFEGTDGIDPALDLKTQRVIQAVTANVAVRGTLSKPEIVLSSTPPLEQADILALIVFNQNLNQLGEGEQVSLAQRAQGMALGAVAGQLTQSIGGALGLDTLELNLAPESGAGPELTIGEQLGQNLYVKVQQGLGDQGQTNFILEYELKKWLRFRTNVVQGSTSQSQLLFQRTQSSGADIIVFFGF